MSILKYFNLGTEYMDAIVKNNLLDVNEPAFSLVEFINLSNFNNLAKKIPLENEKGYRMNKPERKQRSR